MMKGILYLIPSLLDDTQPDEVLPRNVIMKVRTLRHFIVENERTARRFLIKLEMKELLDEIHFELLNKHTRPEELEIIMAPLDRGVSMGLISEAGCPGIADPGADIAAIGHRNGIRIVPLTGPSSILLALMASGLNGQNFAFKGYLPVKQVDRIRKIKHLEDQSRKENLTQIFIEAPYRNHQMLEDLLSSLNLQTRLCLAINLTGAEEKIITKTVAEWRKVKIDFQKDPAVFLFLA